MENKIFAQGLIVKGPIENAPEFVKGSLSIKVDKFKSFLDEHNTNSGWVNFDMLLSAKKGTWYAQLNTYKPAAPKLEPKEEIATIEYPTEDINPEDVPF